MNLIDRYIHEVGHFLPYKNRADIQAELRSLLMDTLEARVQGEASEDDVVTLLKEFGPPQKVAASYWPEGQYLIGPRLFPVFRTVVGIALAVMVGVYLLISGINLAFNQDLQTAARHLTDFFGSALSMLGAIVVVFYVLQQFNVRVEQDSPEWDPRQLPAPQESEFVKRGETIFEIIFALVFLALLLAFSGGIPVVPSLGEKVILISDPVIVAYLPWIVGMLFLGLGLDVILLWQGRWQRSTRIAKLILDLAGIGLLGVLIAGHNAWLAERGVAGFFVVLTNLPANHLWAEETIQILIMQSVRLALVIALVVTIVVTLQQVYRWGRWALEAGSIANIVPAPKGSNK